MIKGLLFDLGGTLFSYAGRGQMGQSLFATVQSLNLDMEPKEIGRAWRKSSNEVNSDYSKREYFLHRDLFRDTLTHFAAQFATTVPAAIMEQFEDRQRSAVVDHLPIRDDCLETLQALKAKGLYLAIVSNIDDDYLSPLVTKHGLDNVLDHWTSSEEAQSCKPDTAIYHYSLDKAGFSASEGLFVGDSLHHDVAGASAVGMRSVRISEPGIETPLTNGLAITAQPDYEITQLSELIAIVDDLND